MFYKISAYALGACALTFMGMTFMYQAEVQTANARVGTIKQVRTVVIEKPVYIQDYASKETLAAKNKNPLNVKALKNDKWQGQIGIDAIGHAVFETWEHGMRAGAIVLKNYAKRHGINTVTGIIERFAEGNQEEYIAFMCKRLNVKADEKINIIKRMPEILRAMARFESGEKLPDHLFVAYDILGRL